MDPTLPSLGWLSKNDKNRPLLGAIKFGDTVIPWPHDAIYWFAPQRYETLDYSRMRDMVKDRKINIAKGKAECISALYAYDKRLDNKTVFADVGSDLPDDIFTNPYKREQLFLSHQKHAKQFKQTPIAEHMFYAYLAHRISSLKKDRYTETDICQIVYDLAPANTFYYDEMLKKKGIDLFSIYGDDAKMLYDQLLKGV